MLAHDSHTIARLELAAKLKAARIRLGYSQRDVARSLHMDRSSWARRETGEISLRTEELDRICQLLGINKRSLLD